MPFITEELYQRLPRTDNTIPSICIASYPNSEIYHWKNEQIEQEMQFVQKIAKAIRSARSDYNLINKMKTKGKYLYIL